MEEKKVAEEEGKKKASKGDAEPRQGKVSRAFLESAVFANLGAERRTLLVGPGHGMDNAVVSLGKESVLIVTSDPLSVIPSIGLSESAWLSVHLLASDLATSGVAPQFAMFDLNLPPEMDIPSVAAYLKAMGDECRALGIAIAGGHTGRYTGSGYTVVGGGMMFSVTDKSAYVTPAMAREDDSILITKGAAIGATAVLSNAFPVAVGERIGPSTLAKARSRLRDCSTVRDALSAASVGIRGSGVTSMHDATEGGVLGGLFELSSACGRRLTVAREKIHIPDEAKAVCEVFGLDPLVTLSEGTLIITCKAGATGAVIGALAEEKIGCYEVGKVGGPGGRGGGHLWLSDDGSKPRPHVPAADAYWDAYSGATASNLR